LSPPLPSSLAPTKLANPGSPGIMAVEMEREEKGDLMNYCSPVKTTSFRLKWFEVIINF